VRVNVIHQGVGGITEGDIMLASASGATVVGFNVRPNAEARQLADREGVEIRTYRVIYQLTEDIEQALIGMLKPVRTEETIGEVEVRQLFRVSRLGTIAGSYVTSGTVRRNASVRIVRDGTVIYETKISQLKRFKDDVREVDEGFECGILLEGFNDLKEGDVLEIYEVDHHELWQRARLTLSCVAREHREVEELLAGAERYLAGQAFELGQVERELVTLDD
jgi:translation initiation factor IF-2